MFKETESIAENLKEVLSGQPWYGKPILEILNNVNPELVFKKQSAGSHSMIELLYHMITWAEFTEHRLEKKQNYHSKEMEALDWRETDPELHTWNNGIAQFTASTRRIIELLKNCPDNLLDEKVDYREYNFRYLLNGLVQHNIYHLGQIVHLSKSFK